MDMQTIQGAALRVQAYIEHLNTVIGNADRLEPLMPMREYALPKMESQAPIRGLVRKAMSLGIPAFLSCSSSLAQDSGR
jgi:hypothetical protein